MLKYNITDLTFKKVRGLSPQANYTDRATGTLLNYFSLKTVVETSDKAIGRPSQRWKDKTYIGSQGNNVGTDGTRWGW
jgi:hypothetical protein